MADAEMTVSDIVYAGISSDGVVPVVTNPCAMCGRQAVEHSPDPVTFAPRMICCFDDCRHTAPGLPVR